ncbi:MAG: 4Fe-4S dicluster domain-containing protein [Desulfobacteraceae bacterium]|nr:4Fe-4S dicluster domain-containing protein [Desulfobacteraceae bacterium]
MLFTVLLYASLFVFLLGLIYKVSTWFSLKIGIASKNFTTSERISAAAKGILEVIFSPKILILAKVFILDVVLQRRILKEDFLRWLMHMLIFSGFMMLLLMHAFDSFITSPLFEEYYSTVNPFLFLRDFFGIMVLAGLMIAIYRRFILKVPRLKTNSMDYYAIIILAVIMISGILLEGIKITSYTEVQNMVENYSDLDDEGEILALEKLWVKNFGLVSPNVKGPIDPEIISLSKELHNMNCADCHSSTEWAIMGYPAAKLLKPIALRLDRLGGVNAFWYIHFLACFIGLAYLPFSKMFHFIASPISLLANAVMDKDKSHPANIATRQAIELDACTHCGTCSLRCSVAVAFDKIGNLNILPSEKLVFLKSYASRKDLKENELKAIQEGIYLCTNCDRCTVVCPVGINLRELWFNVREDLIQKSNPIALVLSPFSFYRGLNRQELDSNNYSNPTTLTKDAIADRCELIKNPDEVISLTPINKDFKEKVELSYQATTYSYCFSCQNCSTVCPVVGNYENPQEALGLLPHQIMRSVGLGLKDLAFGSKMLWDCVTCYQCQEHCPQGVKVTDVLYELKNLAIKETFNNSMEIK